METRIKVDWQGEKVDAIDVTPDEIEPKVFTLKLKDGSKLILTRLIYKVVKLIDKKNENGDPIYQFKIQDMANVVEKSEG